MSHRRLLNKSATTTALSRALGLAPRRSLAVRYGVAVLATAVALFLKLALGPVIVPSAFLTFYAAVLFSAWFGGMGPGLLATALSLVVGGQEFLPPAFSAAGREQLTSLRLVVFGGVGVIVSWLTTEVVRTRERLENSLRTNQQELERRVEERTAALTSANRQLELEIAQRQHAEEQFRRAFQDAPIGMVLVGFDGMPLRVNRAVCAMLGYTEDELMVRSVADVTHPDDMPVAREHLERLLAGDDAAYPMEKRYIHKLGHIVWASLNVSVVRDGAGKPLHLISQVENITDRKRASQELRESESKFRTLTETIGTAVCIFQGPAILYVNPATSRITGYTQDELLAMNFWDNIHPDSRDLMRQRGLARQRGEAVPPQDEVMIVTKSGQVRWVDFTASTIEFEGRAAVLGTAVDITERKQAGELLRESEERFRGTFEQAAVGIAHVGLDGRWLRVNSRLCDIVGYTEAELLAGTFQDITHPDDLDADLEYVRQMLEGKIQTYSMEKRYVRKDSSQVWIGLTVSLIRDSAGAAKYFISVVQDIEARKRAEAAIRRAHDELEARIAERTADLAASNRALQAEITERKRAEEELVLLNKRGLDLLESIADGFFALDREDRFTYLNPGAERLLAVQRERLIGRSVWEVFPQAVGTPFYTQYQRVLSEQVPLDTEAYYPPLNRWFKAHAYPSHNGVSVLFEDVTERHEREVSAISDILRALNAHLRVDAAFADVAAGLHALTSCDRSSLTLFDEEYETATVVGLDQARLDVAPGTRLRTCDIPAVPNVVAGRPHVAPDLAAELHSPIVQRLYADGFRSALCLPLHGSNRVTGMLSLTWRKVDGPNGLHLPLLGQIGDAVALAVEKERLFDEVRGGHERLQALSHRLLEVQEAERHHIARELHDEIGQLLTALKLSLDTIDQLPTESAVARLHDAQQLVNDLVARVRDLSLDLRPAMLDDLGLLPALLWLFGRYQTQTSVRVRFEHTGLDRRFSPDLETAAYRIVQEALTNVARHAGVREATVRVWTSDHTLSVQIIDLGKGFDREAVLATGLTGGLSGLHERGLLLGGQLTIESTPGRGTRIHAELPLVDVVDQEYACGVKEHRR